MGKHRLAAAALALCMALTLVPAAAPAAPGGGLENFQKTGTWTEGQFQDVKPEDWFRDSVRDAWELGLMQGTGEDTFSPGGNMTVGSAVALAARVHSIYSTGRADFTPGEVWYQTYVDYCLSSGIITPGQFSDYDAPATRLQFVTVMAKALPDSALEERNLVEDGAIPDMPAGAEGQSDVYRLYRAGVLSGSDDLGTFHPDSFIDRASVAALVIRMAQPELRQKLTLRSVSTLLNLSSEIDRRAKEIVKPSAEADGFIVQDPEVLEKSSRQVYEYGQELKAQGRIQDVTYTPESWTVAFFLDGNTVCLYVPRVRQTMAGGGQDYNVSSVVTEAWNEDAVSLGEFDEMTLYPVAGARQAARHVKDRISACRTWDDVNIGDWTGMDDIAGWMGSLAEKRTKLIFWQGHGTCFTAPDGTKLAAWTVPAEKNAENLKYRDRSWSVAVCGDSCAITTSFWTRFCGQMNGAVLFSGACSTGADGGQTARALQEKGFAAYAAPDGLIWDTYSRVVMGRTAQYMTGAVDGTKYSIDAALSRAKGDAGETGLYGCTVKLWNADPSSPFSLNIRGYREPYAELLRQKQTGRFLLVDIDSDDNPELAYLQSAEGQTELYTCIDGQAVYLGSLGAAGVLQYSEKNNRIFGYTRPGAGDAERLAATWMISGNQLVQAPDFKNYPSKDITWGSAVTITEDSITRLLNGVFG